VAGCARTPAEKSRVELTGAKLPAIHIRELDVPTKDALPHDPAYAVDGSLWFTEQAANKIGRLDPATGAFREISLRPWAHLSRRERRQQGGDRDVRVIDLARSTSTT